MSKTILITGVSKGLGLQIAKTLLRDKYKVMGISRKKNVEIEILLSNYSGNFSFLEFDLIESDKIKNLIFKNWIGKNTILHGFINNAAFAYDDIITNLNLDSLEKMYKINVFTPMNIVKYTIRQMLLHKISGSIIHISSISVHTGYKGLAMYASSKGALEAFSKNTSREWGELGIRSNCIVAGFMETDMTGKLTNELKERIYKRTSLKKATDMESVANTVSFLLNDASHSITGQNIFVDSGTI